MLKIHPPIWTDREREAWKLPRRITVSQWADENIYLDPKISPEPGMWRTARTPFIREPMDVYAFPSVQQIALMFGTQCAKTACLLNQMGYAIDQDPGPMMIVYPTEAIAKKISKKRAKLHINGSDALRKHVLHPKDLENLEYGFDRMDIHFAWAGSPGVLASWPIRYLTRDEGDKFPKYAGEEGDPFELSEERTSNFWNRKIVDASTPTTREGYIFLQYQKTDRGRYYLPCPECGFYQLFIFGGKDVDFGVKWPEDERDTNVINTENLAWYQCENCQGKIVDIQKPWMLERGLWVPTADNYKGTLWVPEHLAKDIPPSDSYKTFEADEKVYPTWVEDGCEITAQGEILGEATPRPKRGFWLNSIYSPWKTFSQFAAKFLDAQGSVGKLQNFVNSWLAEPFEQRIEEREPEKLKGRRLDYESGYIPDGVKLLLAGLDVQKDHFWFSVHGFGYGEECWLIRAVRLESWTDVINEVMNTLYKYQSGGNTLPIRMCAIDARYRTDEVYKVCRRYPDKMRAVMGSASLAGVPFKATRIDKHPKTGMVIKGGLTVWRIYVDHYKDKASRMMSAEPDEPGNYHLPVDVSPDTIQQLCNEIKIVKRNKRTGATEETWKPVYDGAPNHIWDTLIYILALADMLRVYQMRRPGEKNVHRPQNKQKQSKWLGNRGESGRRGKSGGGWLSGR